MVQRLREQIGSPPGVATSFAVGCMLAGGPRAARGATHEADCGWRLDLSTLATIGLWLIRYRSVGLHRGLHIEPRRTGKTAEGGE